MSAFSDRVALDQINAQARQVDFGKAVLVAVAAVLIFVGKMLALAVNAFAWCFVAVRLGYREVRPPRPAQAEPGRR